MTEGGSTWNVESGEVGCCGSVPGEPEADWADGAVPPPGVPWEESDAYALGDSSAVRTVLAQTSNANRSTRPRRVEGGVSTGESESETKWVLRKTLFTEKRQGLLWEIFVPDTIGEGVETSEQRDSCGFM